MALDWKTGSRLYTDYLIQMWAYMEATHMVNKLGVLVKVRPKLQVGHLVQLSGNSYEVRTLKRGTKLYKQCGEAFIHLQGVKHWLDNEKEIW